MSFYLSGSHGSSAHQIYQAVLVTSDLYDMPVGMYSRRGHNSMRLLYAEGVNFQLMANYQNCLLHFWERTSSAHNTVSENFKGYQHYEFTVLKDLAEPSRRLAELTSGNSIEQKGEEEPEKAEEAVSADEQ